jgi:hypothetical protein
MSDDLTALLAEWGSDFEEELGRVVGDDTPLRRSLVLVAAVEAVLGLTGTLSMRRVREAIRGTLGEETGSDA